MTDNILSQSDGSANLPGQGGRMHGGKSSLDDPTPSKAGQATPERPRDSRRGWRPIMIGLACLIAGVGFFVYRDQDVDRVADPRVPVAPDQPLPIHLLPICPG